jgi:hypothetical protein
MASASPMAPEPKRSRRPAIVAIAVIALALGALVVAWNLLRFPPDTTPEGAYLRVAASITRGETLVVFSYLEDDAQHAAFTIRDYRKRASERATKSFPEPERSRLTSEWRAFADAPDGADVWQVMAERRGWIARLRSDLSAVAKVETSGERATVVTARGTRYGLRRRANGMWGLTLFTAELLAESERAARDWDVVDRAAADYDRGR